MCYANVNDFAADTAKRQGIPVPGINDKPVATPGAGGAPAPPATAIVDPSAPQQSRRRPSSFITSPTLSIPGTAASSLGGAGGGSGLNIPA